MGRTVEVTSMVNGRVLIAERDIGLYREWPRKGTKIKLDFEKLQEGLYRVGVFNLFKEGFLYIEDLQDKIDLDLEPEGAQEPSNIIVVKDDQIGALFALSNEKFREEVSKLSIPQRQNVCDYAIANRIMDFGKNPILKKLCAVDVIQSIILDEKDKEETAEKEA